MSVLPKISMKQGGDRIRFWRAEEGMGANQQSTPSERLDAMRLRTDEVDHAFHQILNRIQRANGRDASCDQDLLRAEHAALTELQTTLASLDDRASRLQTTLADHRTRLLAGWRVTEREILSVDAVALRRDIEGLTQAVRRQQVQLAATLIEFD